MVLALVWHEVHPSLAEGDYGEETLLMLSSVYIPSSMLQDWLTGIHPGSTTSLLFDKSMKTSGKAEYLLMNKSLLMQYTLVQHRLL